MFGTGALLTKFTNGLVPWHIDKCSTLLILNTLVGSGLSPEKENKKIHRN